jgi:aryl-alcohol dehydrogenase-like predicted oxidoreductase
MRYRRLGSTDLAVSVVGVGTWQFGGEWGRQFEPREVRELLAHARDSGVNLIDTAECYGDHASESLIGAAVARERDRWVIATKFGHSFSTKRGDAGQDPRTEQWSAAEVVAQLEASLRALQTDYVDVYQAHGGTDDQVANEDLWDALRDQVRAGKIRHLGISLGPPDDLGQAERAAEVGAGVVQVTYNRLTRDAEDTVLPRCLDLDLGVLAREPLANGYLGGRYKPGVRVTDVRDWRSAHDPREVDRTLEAVAQIAADEVPDDVPLARWAVAWCLKHPAVTAAIPGARNLEQLASNVAVAEVVAAGHPQEVAAATS